VPRRYAMIDSGQLHPVATIRVMEHLEDLEFV
jgi:hypothetical protein